MKKVKKIKILGRLAILKIAEKIILLRLRGLS